MIPRRLTLEGVYSYKKRQIIDFNTLSEAGIFGVFGNVGSGKSAILESMTYALYGQIERLNDKEQRGYNIMNLQASALFIDFEFFQDGSEYRFTVSSKRNKKDFSKIQSPERRAYKKENGQWIPLPDEGMRGGITAESIIGLNYEHFRKTVIIPQGKFQEFIQLPPSQRTGMIETLFGLERFNLSADCNFLLARSREECSFLEGRLDDLKDLNQSDLEILLLKSREIDDDLQRKNARKKELNELLTALVEYRKTRTALDETIRALESLESEKEEIQKTEELLAKTLKLDELFTKPLNREEEIIRELKGLSGESENLKGEIKKIQALLREGEEYWFRLKKDQEDYSQLRRKLDSLKALLDIEELTKRENQDELRRGMISKELQSFRAKRQNLNQEKKEKMALIADLEHQIDIRADLSEIEDWFRQMDIISEKKIDLVEQINSLKSKETQSRIELRDNFSDMDLPGADSKDSIGSTELWEQKILGEIHSREEQLKIEEDEYKEYERNAGRTQLLREMSEALVEGQPCPLCGSEHHPGAHKEIPGTKESSEPKALDEQRRSIQNRKELLLSILPGLKFLEQERLKKEELLIQQEKMEQSHKASFKWALLTSAERDKFNVLKDELAGDRSKLKEQRQTIQVLEEQLREIDSKVHEKEGEQIRLETKAEHLNQQKKALEEKIIKEHQEQSPDPEEYKLLHQRLEDLDRDYLRIKAARDSNEKIEQDLTNRVLSTGHLITRASDELNSLKTDIEKTLEEQGLSGREELIRGLKGIEDLKSAREKIDLFHNKKTRLIEQKETLSADVKKFKGHPSLKGNDQADPRDLQDSLHSLEEDLQNILTGAGALGRQIDELQTKLKLKETLSKELEQQKIREQNLKELSSLFKGGKFVQYIASVYMQEMCQMANRRFSPLTGRSLELVFQDNQIMVRDFLNEGRLRHIKTLSGGQSFQAALCLALALAEQTGRGKGSFFFLDEGFGSLDKESLETVMATLRELSREGRIIGLISHVEEMQQDLDVWIRIQRDPEEGSRIRCSWKSSGEGL